MLMMPFAHNGFSEHSCRSCKISLHGPGTQAKEGRHGAPTGLEFYNCIDCRRGGAGNECASCTIATDRRAGRFAVAGLCGGPRHRLEKRSPSNSAATGALGSPPLAPSSLVPPPLGLASPPLASPALGMASS